MERQEIIKKRKMKRTYLAIVIIALFISSFILLIKKSLIWSIISFFSIILIISTYLYFKKILDRSIRIKKLEDVFPDFLQLMSSNLRAGMTIDRAMLLSSRPEFYPLDEEILKTGKDITTGKNFERALLDMSIRINSEKIHKIILLITSGIQAGGNIAILLEETSVSMRDRYFLEKKAASSVLMYIIFIFLAVSIFAPMLFSLSTVLVDVLTKILSGLPTMETSMNLPFTLSKISISSDFIMYFSIIFMMIIDVFASLVIGLVNKGEEKQGLKFFPAIIILSIVIFFAARIFLTNFLKGLL
jgi:archaeal flagellar protein FlaJ